MPACLTVSPDSGSDISCSQRQQSCHGIDLIFTRALSNAVNRGRGLNLSQNVYKMLATKEVSLKQTLMRSAARLPRYWPPSAPARDPSVGGRSQWSEMWHGVFSVQCQPQAPPLSVQLLSRGGGEGGTISQYYTHIPFHDFMPAHPCHKLRCSQHEAVKRKTVLWQWHKITNRH